MDKKQYHADCLRRLCRVCGSLLYSSKKAVFYNSVSKKVELMKVYEIDVSADNDDIHPKNICNTSNRRTTHHLVEQSYNSSFVPFTWSEHSIEDCVVCDHHKSLTRGGKRKNVRGNRGRPKTEVRWSEEHFIFPTNIMSCFEKIHINNKNKLLNPYF